MRNIEGKTAFVTGGASGIGFAIAGALGEAGMKVMLADIEQSALEEAEVGLRKGGIDVRTVLCDVADRAAVRRAADETIAAFGKVHVVCNNAGVAAGGQMEKIPPGDWDWVIDVNVMGVIHGIEAFLPHIKAHGEGGHIINTGSAAGIVCSAGMGPYSASKFAVVGLSETLALELAGTSIGVSVILPAFVRTRIADCTRNRPSRYGAPPDVPAAAKEQLAALVRTGIDPREIARRVLVAVRDEDLYIVTHPEYRAAVEERFNKILAAHDKAATV
jgi:NAD(P)-dependent dehydrogenase (short-subunit alcohol dehydrogenase family)